MRPPCDFSSIQSEIGRYHVQVKAYSMEYNLPNFLSSWTTSNRIEILPGAQGDFAFNIHQDDRWVHADITVPSPQGPASSKAFQSAVMNAKNQGRTSWPTSFRYWFVHACFRYQREFRGNGAMNHFSLCSMTQTFDLYIHAWAGRATAPDDAYDWETTRPMSVSTPRTETAAWNSP